MKKQVKYLIMLISLCLVSLLPQMETKAAEPQKDIKANSIANPNYTFTTINDSTVSTASDGSKATVLIFGRVTCGNTRATTKSISQSSWVKDSSIRVMLATIDSVSKEDTKSFADTYGCPSMTFCYDTSGRIDSAMWNYLSSYGITGGVTLPITVFIDSNNMVQNIMTGNHTADEILAEINRFKNADTSTNTGTVSGDSTKKPETPAAIVRKKNDIINDKKTNGKYRIITTNNKGGSVEYKSPINKKSTSAQIPATVKIDGKSYKVTGIAANAFKGNKKLKSVTIGKNVKTIGKNAFNGCKNLKKIVVKSSKLTKKSVGSKAFKGIYSKAKIKVPKSKLKAYKKLLKSKGIGAKVKFSQ